jgi:pimeloyl-ACP methyl ester carboxylesterase
MNRFAPKVVIDQTKPLLPVTLAVKPALSAPVLWVNADASDTLARLSLDERQHAERRSAFANLEHVTVRDAGHMLHHDQPEAVARLVENFLAS